eukprot:TRINITY_DN4963_c0_g1_i2.p1 TRINITY_DN4963_c0_g1~~TRINITY_DN4963_c0_g1_i2.p1  ORF type:complete len:434 (+),score=70.12 TRINITY_DN4963_c0_g1_i2:67-1302(+)
MLVYLLLGLLLLLNGFESAPSTCGNKRNTNIQGTLVYVNVATYWDLTINSADECCKSCDDRSYLCTGWSFCDDPNGCGTGCADYMSGWMNARENDQGFLGAPLDWTQQSIEADTKCGDKWPQKTCSFKLIDDTSTEIAGGVVAQGWVSGDTGVMDVEPWKCSKNDPTGCCGLNPELYQCADDSCGARQSNIQAKLLKFDVNFERYTRYGGTIGASPFECCELCKENDWCDAWVFCNNEEGCGTGCKATIKDLNNKFTYAELGSPNPWEELSEAKLCTDSDAFTFRLCSLKTFENGQYEELTAGGSGCTDVEPEGDYTCAQYKEWGRCWEPWIAAGGYCECACAIAAAESGECTDVPPPGGHNCAQQKEWGKCDEGWMDGYCECSCGKRKSGDAAAAFGWVSGIPISASTNK